MAACLAGVFSLEDALKLVAAARAPDRRAAPGGAMLAVHAVREGPRALLPGELSIAAVNAPAAGGGLRARAGARTHSSESLEKKGVATRRLHTSHAFHSSLMDPCLDAFREVVRTVALSAPERPVVSCATGTWLSAEQATDPEYWVAHVRGTVRFADGIATLDDGSERLLLEVGPGDTLRSLAELCARGSGSLSAVHCVRHPKEDEDDQAFLLRALGTVWAHGVRIDWSRGFCAGEVRRRVPLPTYPFERESYWVDAGHELLDAGAPVPAGPAVSDRKIPDLSDWFFVPSWHQTAPAVAARTLGRRWLIFVDEAGLGEALGELVRARGGEVITVVPRAAYKRFAPRIFELDPGDPEGYRQLLDELAATGGLPTEIVHLWGVDTPEAIGSRDALQERTFYSLLFLGQALSGRELPGPAHVAVVTSGLQDVFGGRPACPDKATVLGPCKSLGAELEQVTSVSIDVLAEDAAAPETLAARLFDELASPARDPVVALHGPGRWALSYEPVRLEQRPADRAGRAGRPRPACARAAPT